MRCGPAMAACSPGSARGASPARAAPQPSVARTEMAVRRLIFLFLMCSRCARQPAIEKRWKRHEVSDVRKASTYRFMPSASCAASSIFALPRTMASLEVSPRIQQSSISAHTCMSARLGPDKRAWL